jgi:hypothetical protein
MRAAEDFEAILGRLEQAVAEARSLAGTLALAPVELPPAWPELLERAGRAIAGADVPALNAVRADLDAFAGELDPTALPDGAWPVYGALLVNLRNTLEALGAVAGEQPVRVAARAFD